MNQSLGPASFLKRKYSESLKNNPRYSLRAFAEKIGLSQGGLSHILSQRKKLSVSRAYEIAEALKLNETEKQELLLLVQLEGAKSPAVKAGLYEQLKAMTQDSPNAISNLTLENFQLVSNWYGLAILEMVTNFASEWSAEKIANFLGIAKIDAEITLERLLALELIDQIDGKFVRPESRLIVSAHTPSEAIRNYYQGVLDRAKESIQTQTPSEKVVGTEVFAFDPAQLADAKTLTDNYLNQMLDLAKKGKERTEMYQVFTDFFRLNPKAQKEMKK